MRHACAMPHFALVDPIGFQNRKHSSATSHVAAKANLPAPEQVDRVLDVLCTLSGVEAGKVLKSNRRVRKHTVGGRYVLSNITRNDTQWVASSSHARAFRQVRNQTQGCTKRPSGPLPRSLRACGGPCDRPCGSAVGSPVVVRHTTAGKPLFRTLKSQPTRNTPGHKRASNSSPGVIARALR